MGRPAGTNSEASPVTPERFSQTFRVGGMALLHRVPINGLGTLTVSSDEGLVFRPSVVTRKLSVPHDVVHCGATITMAKAVICPPWIDTFVVVHDGKTTVLVGVFWFRRNALRRSLARAGIAVRERWAWSIPISSLYRRSEPAT